MNRLHPVAVMIVLLVTNLVSAMPVEDFLAVFGDAPPHVAPDALPRRDVLWTRATVEPVAGGMSALERDRCQSLIRAQMRAQESGYQVLQLDRPVTLTPRSDTGFLNTRTDIDILIEKNGRRVAIEHKYYPNQSRPLRLTDQVRRQMHTQAALKQAAGYDAYIYMVDGHVTDDVVKHARKLGYRVVRSTDELGSELKQLALPKKAHLASKTLRVAGGLLVGYTAVAHSSGELLEETHAAEHIRDTDRAHARYLAKTAAAVSGTAMVIVATNPAVACTGFVIVIAGPEAIDVVTGKTTIAEALAKIKDEAIAIWEFAKGSYCKVTDAETYSQLWEQLNWDSLADAGRRLVRTSWTVARDSVCRVGQAIGSTMTWGWVRGGDAVRSAVGIFGRDASPDSQPAGTRHAAAPDPGVARSATTRAPG